MYCRSGTVSIQRDNDVTRSELVGGRYGCHLENMYDIISEICLHQSMLIRFNQSIYF